MTRERSGTAHDEERQEETTRGPDETGVSATSKSSPQGDGAEKAPARPARSDERPASEPQ
jgi:hypothetical protein